MGPLQQADELCQRAHVRFRGSGYKCLSKIRCAYREGVLTLDGVVPSFYLKQLAQTIVTDIGGVKRVENRLEVRIEPS